MSVRSTDRFASSVRESERVRELEHALAELEAERRAQADVVESELERLNSIYGRLKTDLVVAREERDRARDEVREERARRARETMELSVQLEQAVEAQRLNSSQTARDDFVKRRLAEATAERRSLDDDELPDIPGFEIRGTLGRGGMATVYRAIRLVDDEEVALKLLRHGAKAARNRTELFLREAAVMLELEHPNLVRALDAGESAYGLYLVLELIEGRSLASVVRERGPLAEADAVKIGVQVARALAFCAKLGLTHRDVKPSNLLLDQDGQVKLCDFGLTALENDSKSRPYGSPGYAAPEQIARPLEVDERVDMYALGCTLWHLVVGRRAFPGKAREAFDLQKRLDLPDPRFEGADVSSGLAQTIRRMGRRNPSERYRRWESCLLDLMLVQRGNPPFAAHLAEAMHPGATDVEPELPDVGVGVPDRESPATDASNSRAVLPADDSVRPGSPRAVPRDPFARASSAPATPPSAPKESVALPRGAQVFAGATVLVLALVSGFFLKSLTTKTVPGQLTLRARALAAEGRGLEAAGSLRAAARLLPAEESAPLLRLADQLEAQAR